MNNTRAVAVSIQAVSPEFNSSAPALPAAEAGLAASRFSTTGQSNRFFLMNSFWSSS
jgi:hypothetical protein